MKKLRLTRAGNKHLGATNLKYYTCDSCRHFNPVPDKDIELTYGDAAKERIREGGYCDSHYVYEYNQDAVHMIEQDSLVAFGSQRIWVGPDFGCLHWSPDE